jgi:hypothetical protein
MYVDTSELHPLDIVIERTNKKPSRVIAHAVSGNYSHAALVISENEIFEATTTGVGFRLPTMDFKRRPWSWYEGSNLGVLSHAVLPHLSHGRQEQLILEARKVCHRLSGKKYAPLADLISLGRRPWLVALQRRFPAVLRGAAHLFQWLLGFMEAVHSPSEWRWRLLEYVAPDEMKGKRFYCSEVVAYVFTEIGLPFENESPGTDQIVPHDLADKERFFLCSRPIVQEGFPLKPAKLEGLSPEVKQFERETIKAATKAMKSGSKIISSRVPDGERTNAMMAAHQTDGPYSQELWTAASYIDAQRARISALASLLANILDLTSNQKNAISPIRVWGAAVASLLQQQAYTDSQEAVPRFLTTLLPFVQSVQPIKELVDEINALRTRIVRLRTECAAACTQLLL